MSLRVTSDSCLLCEIIIASPVFAHRGQHRLIPFPKGTIKSLYSILLSFYFWPWMFIVSYSSFEQGNVACNGKEKFCSLAICTYIKLCTAMVTLALVDWRDFPKFSMEHLWSVWSCIANSTPRCVLGSPSSYGLFDIQTDLQFWIKLHITQFSPVFI
jgi:hypothetical protein